MESFTTSRNTRLSYIRSGRGRPVVCVPGGPLLPSRYLGDLGGLDRHVELVFVEPSRTDTGEGQVDVSALRCDRVADDLDALRLHLGLDEIDLIGHSAGANVVVRYAERHPEHVGRMLLVTPSTRAVGIDIADEARSRVARTRSTEPWYGVAAEALVRIQSGKPRDDDGAAIAPFSYGSWDRMTAAFDAGMDAERDPVAAMAFGADGAFDPSATRTALAALRTRVTIVAGSLDVAVPVEAMEQFAALFAAAELVVQEGAGHFPWIDDPAAFVATARCALSEAS